MNHETSPYIAKYFEEMVKIAHAIDQEQVRKMVDILLDLRERGGRLFVLGVGGGAGNASHAVNDFRKIAGIEAYAPTDNVSELTARVNDEGWESVFERWLNVSKLAADDALFIMSVGGGDRERNISSNIVNAIQLAKARKARIIGIVGRDGGFTGKNADAAVIVPTMSPETVTPHTEAFQAVIWHLLVSHPEIQRFEMKWESVK